MAARLNLPRNGLPERCSCGLVYQDTASMIVHLLESGAYRDGRGGLQLDPGKPHGKEHGLGEYVVSYLPAGGAGSPGARRGDIPGGREGHGTPALDLHLVQDPGDVPGTPLPERYQLPWWSRTWWAVAAGFIFHIMTVFVVMFLSVVAGFFSVPVVLMPLLNGPLAPWGQILAWLWVHGELSIPLALVVLGAFVWGRTRWRLQGILEDVLVYGTILTLSAAATGVAVWAVWRLWPLMWR